MTEPTALTTDTTEIDATSQNQQPQEAIDERNDDFVFLVYDSTLNRTDSSRIVALIRESFEPEMIVELERGFMTRESRSSRIKEIEAATSEAGKSLVHIKVFYDINDLISGIHGHPVGKDVIFVQAKSEAERVKIYGVVQENDEMGEVLGAYWMLANLDSGVLGDTAISE